MPEWVFEDPPNLAVITTRGVVEGRDWIAYVSHDADDGGWQFHDSDPAPPQESEAMVVSLRSIVQLDPTIVDLVDLPIGWRAWRESKGVPWHRTPATRKTE